MSNWLPINTFNTDNARKHMFVVLYDGKEVYLGCVEDLAGKLVVVNEEGCPWMFDYDGITHWMPIQKPTKEGKSQP